MGQWSDRLLSSPDFAALRANAAYSEIQRTMKGNRAPVSRASTAFTLTDTNLLPEDIDYDPGSKRFLITSVHEMKVVAVDVAGHAQDFAKAPDAWPMMAIRVDGEHNMVWATEAALEGFTFVPKSDWGRSAVLSFDLKTGKQLRRLEAPRGAALGDMALLANGDVIVSDGQAGAVYRLAASGSALERIDAGDFISPQTPALYPDGAHVFVPDYLRGIAVLDLTTKRVRWLSTEGKFALSGIDGLYFSGGRLIAVQNGASPERVAAFTLDSSLTQIVSETVIERSTTTLGDPTHGVFLGNDFYYIANSGWDKLDDSGNLVAGAKPSAPRVMRASLKTK
jgi:hypothetical protein